MSTDPPPPHSAQGLATLRRECVLQTVRQGLPPSTVLQRLALLPTDPPRPAPSIRTVAPTRRLAKVRALAQCTRALARSREGLPAAFRASPAKPIALPGPRRQDRGPPQTPTDPATRLETCERRKGPCT